MKQQKERISWIAVLEEHEREIESGLVVEIETPTPAQHIALRSAALGMGYSACLRSGKTLVAKQAQLQEVRGGKVRVKVKYKLSEPPTIMFKQPTTIEEARLLFETAMFGLLKNGITEEASTRGTLLDLALEAFWVYGELNDHEMKQPTSATIREVYEKYTKLDDLKGMLDEWFNALVRLKVAVREAFKEMDVIIPLVTPEDAMSLLEERYKNRLAGTVERNERRLDFRQQSEAETEKNLPLSDEINA